MRILIILLLFSISLSLSTTANASSTTAEDLLSLRWESEISYLEDLRIDLWKIRNSEALKECRSQNQLFKWLFKDNCEDIREDLQKTLYIVLEINQEVTKTMDIQLNNLSSDHPESLILNSKSTNFEIYERTRQVINNCLEKATSIYKSEVSFKNNVRYYNAAKSAVACYRDWVIEQAN